VVVDFDPDLTFECVDECTWCCHHGVLLYEKDLLALAAREDLAESVVEFHGHDFVRREPKAHDHVEVDGREIVTSSFTRLQDDTVELARISAYQRADDPNYVFDLTQLDFQHQIRAVITPHQEITFRRQRADLNLS